MNCIQRSKLGQGQDVGGLCSRGRTDCLGARQSESRCLLFSGDFCEI